MDAVHATGKPGRPKGSRSFATVLREGFEASLKTTAAKAAAGDEQAQRLLLESAVAMPELLKAG